MGASGVPVNLVFTWIGHTWLFAGLSAEARSAGAFTLGIAVSIFTNFIFNDLWTWGDRDKQRRGFWGRLGRFYLACSLASAVQFGVAMVLNLGVQLHYLLAQLTGIAVATVLNYAANNLWTFNTNKQR